MMKTIKLKCAYESIREFYISDYNLIIGETYTANYFAHGYYYIHEIEVIAPVELFITLSEWRESKIDDILS